MIDTDIYTAIADRSAAFAWTADVGHLDDFRAFFTDDARWEMPGAVWVGIDEIVSGLGSMREAGYAGPEAGTRHLIHNLSIADEFDGTKLGVRSLYTLIGTGEAPRTLSTGAYEDEWVRRDERWLIQSRRVSLL